MPPPYQIEQVMSSVRKDDGPMRDEPLNKYQLMINSVEEAFAAKDFTAAPCFLNLHHKV